MTDRPTPPEDPIRPHVFDGIAEYDKKMPNWWLNTLYATIVVSILYWFAMLETPLLPPDEVIIERKMARLEAARMAGGLGDLDDPALWRFSRNPDVVAEGRATYLANCASCHGQRLEGGIGVNLVDGEWVHGGAPLDVLRSVNEGVPARGMPAWESALGPRKVAEAVAFILSHHAPPDAAE